MDFDVLIIGAGVIGISVAEIFARNNFSVLVIEKEKRHGTGISSRNSEVIHSGIYYPPNSLKSKLCIKGKNLLYNYCDQNKIPHKKIGKLIVATNESEIKYLEMIRENSFAAGVTDLEFVSAEELKLIEPEIICAAALFSPSTGIISAHDFMDSLKIKSENDDANYLFNSKIKSVEKNSQSTGYFVEIEENSKEVTKIEVDAIINCAGLYADKVSEIIGATSESYRQRFVKGNYFKLNSGKNLFKHLIYPVPNLNLKGLGIHITIDLNGEIRFGPDTEELSENSESYLVDEKRKIKFFEAIKRYFPKIELERLTPDFAGIRPKLASKEFSDFVINEETEKGFRKVVNCIGIESPGLTASLAIAEYIFEKVRM